MLAVDTALLSMQDAGIRPDAVVVVESQFWIERAFIGLRNSGIPVFADMTSFPGAVAVTGGPVCFFCTEYTKASFLDRFIDLETSVPLIPPLGSVGLTALYLALRITQDSLPVFFTGLDFSWGKAFTHSKGAPASREILYGAGRLEPAAMPSQLGVPGVFITDGKTGNPVFTNPALSDYARLLSVAFSNSNRIFDIRREGLQLEVPAITEEEAEK
ncbi:6-hydroxymethylpterin diphosphokinase MptE-like protein [Brucepastera parasyntrophica]|uniref:6-hydroxymethylpterin diphosphokinase MptE-like protein n=1 Tax=Brucepastera parasyntrophica TaxID=2880008 RepID=UPI003F71F5DD